MHGLLTNTFLYPDIKMYWLEDHAPNIHIRLPEVLRRELSHYIETHNIQDDELLFQ